MTHASTSHTLPALRSAPATSARPGFLASTARRSLFAALKHLRTGCLIIHDESGTSHTFGQADSASKAQPKAEIVIKDARFYSACLSKGTLGAAESYIDGWWESDTLTDLIRLFVVNRQAMRTLDSGWSKLLLPFRLLLQSLSRNTHAGSRRNIAAHYDLSNDLFALMLDPTMMYSCALFDPPTLTLQQASTAKLDLLCRKLQLRPTDHLLEIGTGWGGMAIHAASHYGCRVTTTTISREQAQLARQRIAEAGLEGHITVIEQDYRDLTGTYDKLVSIEMIEAVGHQFLDAYFAACGRLLKPDGLMALQAITIQDRDYADALRQVDFIQKHIFPGSFIPSLGAIQSSLSRASLLRPIHIQDIGDHYVRTLDAWRTNFMNNLEQVRALGFDARFIRLWDFYLCYCQGAFHERHIGDAQLVLAGPAYRGSSTPAPSR